MGQIKLSEKQELLNTVNSQIRTCEKCKLSLTRKHALTGEGNINARIMFIALSPGTKEDAENKMFIGPSGRILNRLLQAANIKRESIFMTNLIKCTLPKNRKPKRIEIESCSYILNEEIKIIKPEIIVPLGYYASRYILNKYEADISESRTNFKNIIGQLLDLNGIKIFPITHPSALLYNPSFEPKTIENYIKLKSLL